MTRQDAVGGPEELPVRRPFWLRTPGGEAAAWLHLPAGPRARPHAVVVCPPFGYEYTHSHRSLVHLADALATAGLPAVRIDYVGTGDSQGDARTPGLFERWLGTIESAAARASDLAGGAPCTLLGLRFGALLAGLVAARVEIRHFVAWHPVVRGGRYVREQQALQGFGTSGDAGADGVIEAGGFVLAPETVESVKGASLLEVDPGIRGKALLLERDDLGGDPALREHLESKGVPTEAVTVGGYLEMMAEPQYTVVPTAAIETIVEWVAGPDDGPTSEPEAAALAEIEAATTAEWDEGSVRRREEHVSLDTGGGEVLRGVLTSPAAGGAAPSTAILLLNAGSVHHVGPNRFYVELSRSLARVGLASLRLDLRNLGDSRYGDCAQENHPYPDTALADARAALAWLAEDRGFAHRWLAGLCSGAHAAFRAGLDPGPHPLDGVVSINPLTFHWHRGMTLDTPASAVTARDSQYFATTMRDPAKWLKLLRGQADIGYIVGFVFRKAGEVAAAFTRRALEALHLRPPGELARELTAYPAAGRSLHFVLSSTDPGYGLLRSQGGRTFLRLRRQGALTVSTIENADHTFSREAWRREAIAAVEECLASGSRDLGHGGG